MNYQIQIEDREYTKWTISEHHEVLDLVVRGFARPGPVGLPETFHPLQYKLFDGDCFSFNQDNIFNLLHSPFRELDEIQPAILILSDGKTYGRTENKKRLLYKCIPHNRHLPAFLVPYDIKLELSKHITNKYVLIKYVHWNEKHPLGELVEPLGSVNIYDAFEQYQLYCNRLTVPMTKYTKHIKSRISETDENTLIDSITQKYSIEDRTDEYLFSIDNDTTTDYDDAMSIVENKENGSTRISIYISNVLVWLQELDGWDTYSDRISTIYLPTRKIPMLPQHLSENLCSLIEKRTRFAITMDYVILADGTVYTSFSNTKIIVKKNYRYEADNLLRNSRYKQLFELTRYMSKSICNSHDLVAFWMIKMNQEIGAILYKHKTGIFRLTNNTINNTTFTNTETNNLFDIETERTLYNFHNHICSEYSVFKEGETYMHSGMLLENYVHFTSPIRRIVDLLNQLYFWKLIGYIHTNNMVSFLEKWTSSLKISYVNTTMKAIRKTQTSCELVYLCYNANNSNETYTGIVFEKNISSKDSTMYEYTVYIKELKHLSRIKCKTDICIHSLVECRIFTFYDKSAVKEKVVLQIIE
jgi:exoribonuclease R